MSYRLPATRLSTSTCISGSGSSSNGDENDRISDWASSLGPARRTKSLFDETILPTPEEALSHDEKEHSFRLREVGDIFGLDLYGRMKLVNWIRKTVSRLD